MTTLGCPAGMESDDSEDELWDEFENVPQPPVEAKTQNAVKADTAIKSIKSQLSSPKRAVKMLNSKLNSSAMIDDMRVAAIKNQVSIAEDYLIQGFEVDTVLRCGWTALMFACSCGYSEMVSLLLKYKANVNYTSPDDMITPLLTACSSKRDKDEEMFSCVELLVSAGADVNAYDRHHMTSLMYASSNRKAKIVKHLISKGTNLDMIDNRGWTALFWAASKGNGQIVRFLLENKADASIVSFSSQNASDLALCSGYPVIGRVLENFIDANKLPEDCKEVIKGLPMSESRSSANVSNSCVKYGELEMFLSSLNLQDLIPLFNEQKIPFESLLTMDESDLEKVGVKQLGSRRNIVKAVAGLHKKDWDKASMPNLKKKFLITSEDVAHIILISGHHLSFLDSSVHYLHKQLRKNPEILKLSKDKADVSKMISLTENAMKNGEQFLKQCNLLRSHLYKVKDDAENMPVGHIMENGKMKQDGRSLVVFGGFLIVAGIFGLFLNKDKLSIVIKQHPWL